MITKVSVVTGLKEIVLQTSLQRESIKTTKTAIKSYYSI